MYHVAVRKDFMAQHYLIGGDWGEENQKHTHHYVLELDLRGKELDQHGYLVDIDDIERNLKRVIKKFSDKTLNDMPEFKDQNPSLERFARIICEDLFNHIKAENINQFIVTLWENEVAWASYEMER